MSGEIGFLRDGRGLNVAVMMTITRMLRKGVDVDSEWTWSVCLLRYLHGKSWAL